MSAMDLPFALPGPGRDYGGSAITSNLELQSPPLLVCNFLRFYYATIKLGKLITTLNKSETYLMVGIEDAYDLWLGGKKLEKGAYVAISLYGDAPKESYDKLTGQICNLLSAKLGIPGNAVYVTYHPVNDWGWNGKNF